MKLLKMDDDEIASFSALSDNNGEITKNELLIHTKNSSFWKEFQGSKAKPCSHTSKVGKPLSSYSWFAHTHLWVSYENL